MNGFWEHIPHGGILSQPKHTREGIGPSPNDMTDFNDSPMECLILPEEWMGVEWGLLGEWEDIGKKELGLVCKIRLL